MPNGSTRPLVALVALLVLGAVAGTNEPPADPAFASHVAFVLRDGRPAVVDPGTGRVTLLALEPQRAAFPSWSPDGEHIAFATLAGSAARIDVADPHAGAVRSVYSSPSDAPIYVSWGPSGDLLAMLAVDREGMALHLVDVATASSRLFARGSPFFWSWTRAGDRLLVHRDVLGEGAVVGFTALGAFDVAEPLPHPGVFQSPALSPSERYVAYGALLGGTVRRVVVAPTARTGGGDAFEKREVAHGGQASLAWHPRHDLLAMQRGEPNGFGSISLLDAVTGDLEVVVEGRALAFFWSPDGGSIAFLTPTLGLPGSGRERRVNTTVEVQDARLPRLTINVLDVATGLVHEVADFVPTTLFVEQFLPFFDQYARSHRVWSPRSDALVFTAIDRRGESMITLFGLDGSVTPLVAGDMPSFNVR